jgi:hypothetical protein
MQIIRGDGIEVDGGRKKIPNFFQWLGYETLGLDHFYLHVYITKTPFYCSHPLIFA